jgi:hypothetical protein
MVRAYKKPAMVKRRTQDKYAKQDVIKALEMAKGMTSMAARVLRCRPEVVQAYIDRYPEIAAVQAAQREEMLDMGELALVKAVQQGEGWAIQFLLKTQGKTRGYVERQELTGADGGPIQNEDVTRLSDRERFEQARGLLELARERAARQAAKRLDAPKASDST